MRVAAWARGPLILVTLGLAAAACLPSAVRPTPTPVPTPPPTATPSPPPTPTPGPPTPTPAPTFLLHTVVRGDTLTSLGRKYRTSGRSIAYWNREQYPSLDPETARYDPDNLQRGWVLQVMPGKEYVPPADDGETGEQVTPEPDDFEDYETEAPGDSAQPEG